MSGHSSRSCELDLILGYDVLYLRGYLSVFMLVIMYRNIRGSSFTMQYLVIEMSPTGILVIISNPPDPALEPNRPLQAMA